MKRIILIILVFVTGPCFADWFLTNKASSFNYFTKKNNTLEVNSFNNMEGSISSQGILTLKVDLGSIDTNNTDRNLVIQDLFLETKNFQEATVTIELGQNFIHSLEFSKASHLSFDAKVVLRGIIQENKLDLILIRLTDDFLIIKTYQPFSLKLADFDLNEGLRKLRHLSSFENVSSTVPLSFNLFYKKFPDYP